MVNRLHSFSAEAGFSWSPNKYLLAAGSTFEDSTLEIFKLDLDRDSSQYKTTIKTGFNAIAWGSVNSQKTYGIIATGKEHGELELWDPLAILNHKNSEECLMMKNTMHTSKINSLDFNLFQTNLLASVGNQNEVYIWDLNNPHTPYGPRSSKMDHVRTVAWNGQVQHILSTASTNGFTTIWDLRNKKEIMILPQHSNPISSIAWHPDNATQIITASDDATMSLWDLRHAHAPEKTLKGHSGSVLSISWCRQDPNLLTSSGSDGQILLWNPNTAELHGKIADYNEGAFQVNWCPHQPHLLASASLEGSIDIHSIQSFKLKSSPRWLRRPIGTSFGHSGKLVTFQKKTVHITSIDTDPDIIKRSEQLESATSDLASVDAFIQDRIRISNKEDWKLLRTLFSDNAREQVIRHLGFQKEHILSTAQSLNNRPPPKTISALFTSETESFFSQMTPLDLLPKSPIDRSITEAIVLGDFETAVDLCLNSERYPDALLIASCGGSELFELVQKVYIERYASRHSYLLVLKSLLDQDLGSIVNQASLDHWSLVLAILCTFSSPDEFGILGETLGDRLAGAHKSNAALVCYLVSGQFIKVSDHWISQEDQSLQELVEKVTIYRKAIHYQDQALLSEGPYPLASLYQKYCEYAQWMITQDKLQIALKYIQLVPSQFPGRQKLLLSIQQSSPPGSDHYYTAPRQWH